MGSAHATNCGVHGVAGEEFLFVGATVMGERPIGC
jgi:hypothetical protein